MRENLEKWKILGFLSFRCQFEILSFKTLQLSRHESLLDNQSFPC